MIPERLRGRLEGWLLRVWFGKSSRMDRLLAGLAAPVGLPLSWLVAAIARRRRGRIRRQPTDAAGAVPVIVVGNLVVGGSGKTPLVAAIGIGLAGRGFRPGLIARGYRSLDEAADATGGSAFVSGASDPEQVGDEAVMLASQTGLPVAIGRDRAAALARLLARHPECDVVISDDGLQHVGLPRRLELLAIDERGFGNGRCVPAGPLREPADRIATVDAVIRTGAALSPPALASPAGRQRQFSSRVEPVAFQVIDGSAQWTPTDFPARFGRDPLTAIAGIARPERFFETLRHLGLAPDCHRLPDHARIDGAWLASLPGRWILMTAKDAIKCRRLPAPVTARCVCLEIAAVPEPALLEWLEAELVRDRPARRNG